MRAMGWLGWTEEVTLRTTVPSIELALEGRAEMLNKIFGKGEPEPEQPKVSARPFSLELFDAMFDGGK